MYPRHKLRRGYQLTTIFAFLRFDQSLKPHIQWKTVISQIFKRFLECWSWTWMWHPWRCSYIKEFRSSRAVKSFYNKLIYWVDFMIKDFNLDCKVSHDIVGRFVGVGYPYTSFSFESTFYWFFINFFTSTRFSMKKKKKYKAKTIQRRWGKTEVRERRWIMKFWGENHSFLSFLVPPGIYLPAKTWYLSWYGQNGSNTVGI